MYPKVVIDINKFKHNVNSLIKLCNKYDINISAVSKVFCADEKLISALIECGIKEIADSRIQNLKKFQDKDVNKLLLRLPAISEAEEVVKYSNISLNSELETMEALGQASQSLGKAHKIILMLELGDLREGILTENFKYTVKEILKIKGLELAGLGVNLTCYGAIKPTPINLGELVKFAKILEDKYGIKNPIISGGNSSTLPLLINGTVPSEINNLRLGESIALGKETVKGTVIDGLFDDTFTLEAEIIELKVKNSVPTGEICQDAFGKVPVFEDKGKIKRAILAIGKQDFASSFPIPLNKDLEIMGASSDHLIVDITNSKINYKTGDIIKFKLDYGSLLGVMTSEYVSKEYI